MPIRDDIQEETVVEQKSQPSVVNELFPVEKPEEHWVRAYWRPAMGWLYMLICAMDFVIFPAIAMFMPVFYKLTAAITMNYVAWQSITLSNGGLMHLAFGAILGVTAWTRGQEKTAVINRN